MSETIEKNQADSTSIEKPDDSTWNTTIKYVRDEISKCLDTKGLDTVSPSSADLCQILNLSNRLKSLACTLDKLEAVYRELSELREIVSENQGQACLDASADQS